MRNLAATVLLGLSFTLPAPAQEQPERLGLVLSGGGAKGLAHIGVLKVLEEEGIRPEVITGTSMGALIGGLYACGYSAGQIEEMVLGIHWGDLLTNKLPLDRIAMEEKPYYGRFLLELPFNGIRPQLPSGLIRGQKIDELLRRQTLPWHGTTSFDSLPIPFACIATDVGNGRAVVMQPETLQVLARNLRGLSLSEARRLARHLIFDDGVLGAGRDDHLVGLADHPARGPQIVADRRPQRVVAAQHARMSAAVSAFESARQSQ